MTRFRIGARTRAVAALGGALLVSGLAGGPAAAAPRPAPDGQPATTAGVTDEVRRLVVRLAPGASAGFDTAVTGAGGRVVAHQPGIGTVVVEGGPGLAAALGELPGVLGVAADRQVTLTGLGFDPGTQPGSMTNVTALTGATELWKRGVTGAGVDVALIDTGVVPVSGLRDPHKVVVGPDLSFESQRTETRHLDTYGHGTHMAGIIAGRETGQGSGAAYAADRSNFYGMAPDARLISIKVADHNGLVDVSQVLAAIDWVVQFGKRDGLNVRVLNLSFGLDSKHTAENDPLSWAADVAWQRGVVVVASAGNNGDLYPGLNSPAYNPRVIAVGAVDTRGTPTVADDTVPGFSARQDDGWRTRGPDLLAPGVGIASLNVPGSMLSESYPAARINTSFIRGSGTSQAAAVVSGAAALLIQQRPALTPDQVKALLTGTARPVPNTAPGVQGAGGIDLVAAAGRATPKASSSTQVRGYGDLREARGSMILSLDGVALDGEVDIFGNAFNSWHWAKRSHGAQAWSADGSWNGSPMTGAGFVADTVTLAGRSWNGRSWNGRSWNGRSWNGRSWNGAAWTGRTWNGAGWSGGAWDSPMQRSSWATGFWATGSWR